MKMCCERKSKEAKFAAFMPKNSVTFHWIHCLPLGAFAGVRIYCITQFSATKYIIETNSCIQRLRRHSHNGFSCGFGHRIHIIAMPTSAQIPSPNHVPLYTMWVYQAQLYKLLIDTVSMQIPHEKSNG